MRRWARSPWVVRGEGERVWHDARRSTSSVLRSSMRATRGLVPRARAPTVFGGPPHPAITGRPASVTVVWRRIFSCSVTSTTAASLLTLVQTLSVYADQICAYCESGMLRMHWVYVNMRRTRAGTPALATRNPFADANALPRFGRGRERTRERNGHSNSCYSVLRMAIALRPLAVSKQRRCVVSMISS